MNEIITKDKEFKDLILVIREQQVMLDRDLAILYGTEVKRLIQQVKRNIEKFPADFMFQLTKDEMYHLRSQNVTADISTMSRSNSYVFTEQGIYMVATILKNDIATQQSIYIMRSFKEMKHLIAEHQSLLNNTELLRLSNTVMQNTDDIQDIRNTMATKTDINNIMGKFIDEQNIKEKIFLNGQIFDAAEAYINIYKQAKKDIYIIDDYISIDTLDFLKYKQKGVNLTIFTANKGEHKLTKTVAQKFAIQYPKLSIKHTSSFHDRFIIIDYNSDSELFYVCGASSKDAGRKVCTIIQLQDKDNMHLIIDRILRNEEYVF